MPWIRNSFGLSCWFRVLCCRGKVRASQTPPRADSIKLLFIVFVRRENVNSAGKVLLFNSSPAGGADGRDSTYKTRHSNHECLILFNNLIKSRTWGLNLHNFLSFLVKSSRDKQKRKLLVLFASALESALVLAAAEFTRDFNPQTLQ